MNPIKIRLTGFTAAIVCVAVMIGLAAHATWQQVGSLGEKLTSVQIESFQTADQFRANLQGLDLTLLRYAIHHQPADKELFLRDWKKVDQWIDVQRPRLTTLKEGQILDKINVAYDDYFKAATNLLNQINGRAGETEPILARFEEVDLQSQRLLSFGYQLVEAHRESLSRYLAESKRSLLYLRAVIFSALVLLLALVAWMAFVVYREMIEPLRVKLVETTAMIERQEKLASLGMLAAGVAHEIRNPLTAIKARLFTQMKLLKAGTSEREDAEVIGAEINRLDRIVKDFLLFARPGDPEFQTVNAMVLLEETRDLLAPQLEKMRVQLNLEQSSSVKVRVDPQQIKQVIINLIQNATDSIGQGGVVTLRARRDTARLANALTEVVVLEVADTGKGMTSEVEKRLFDPFFTTKEAGTGLGLPIAARIVEKHGGVLQYQTHVNHGTTFGVVLPAAQPNE